MGSAVVVTALGGPGFTVSSSVVRQRERRPARVRGCGCLGDGRIDAPHKVLLMIVDGLTREQHELVRGAYSVLGASVPMVGGCSADNVEYVLTNQFHGTGAGVERLVDSIVAVGLGSNAPIGIGIAHGWAKQGDPMVVTSSDGGEVFLIDDEPALDVYLRRIGADRSLLDDGDAVSRGRLPVPARHVASQWRGHSRRAQRATRTRVAAVPRRRPTGRAGVDDDDGCRGARGRGRPLVRDGRRWPRRSSPLGVVVFDCGARKLKLGPDKLSAEQARDRGGGCRRAVRRLLHLRRDCEDQGLARDAPPDGRDPRARLIAARPGRADVLPLVDPSADRVPRQRQQTAEPRRCDRGRARARDRGAGRRAGRRDHRRRGPRERGIRPRKACPRRSSPPHRTTMPWRSRGSASATSCAASSTSSDRRDQHVSTPG